MSSHRKCEYCGSAMSREDKKCPSCGAPLPDVYSESSTPTTVTTPQQPAVPQQHAPDAGLKTSAMATVSMWLGISSIVFNVCCIGGPIGILGLIFGAIALSEIKKGNYTSSSESIAKSGIAFSVLGIVIFIILIIVSQANQP